MERTYSQNELAVDIFRRLSQIKQNISTSNLLRSGGRQFDSLGILTHFNLSYIRVYKPPIRT